jgi:hypothetical protein
VTFGERLVFYPKPFVFSVRPLETHPDFRLRNTTSRALCLYDNAGEHFEPGGETDDFPLQHLALSQVLLFLFDPTQHPKFRRACKKGTVEALCEAATVTVTYSKDHSYAATMAGLAGGPETGEWKLSGDRLIQKAKSSTIDAENVGKEDASTIVKLDAVLMVKSRNRKGEDETLNPQLVR